ncbi:caspase a-like [Scomber japonicus]|uniref:caspase a-like n=1 Tax=Scomber japonicus TaxID=13676 RepID=UPI00230581DE|nr:caspase a-like [Scomber japonicus]
MEELKEELLNILENLKEDDFKKFKWFLELDDTVEGFKGIPVSQLENAAKRKTVDLMVQKHGGIGALQRTKKILKKMKKNDLVEDLQSGPKGSHICDLSPFTADVALKEQWSTTLIPTTTTFCKEKQDEDRVYAVTKKSIMSRVALLITNIKFDNEKHNRRGADIDEQNMKELLEALKYEVVKYTNLTGKGIEEAVKKFSKHPKLEHTDSVFVVIMSHGEKTAVHGVNFDKNKEDKEQDKFLIDDIFTHLNTLNCPKLLNKPKIIIIQACSGGKKGGVLVSNNPSIHPTVETDNIQELHPSPRDGEEVTRADRLGLAHREESFMCFRSSTPDTVSYRRSDTGSFFIQFIVDALNTFAHVDHIDELFGRVMRRFKKFSVPTKTGDDTQMPTKDRGCDDQCEEHYFQNATGSQLRGSSPVISATGSQLRGSSPVISATGSQLRGSSPVISATGSQLRGSSPVISATGSQLRGSSPVISATGSQLRGSSPVISATGSQLRGAPLQ